MPPRPARSQSRRQRLAEGPIFLFAPLFLVVAVAAAFYDPRLLRGAALISAAFDQHQLTASFWRLVALEAWLTPPVLFFNLLSAILFMALVTRVESWLDPVRSCTPAAPDRRHRRATVRLGPQTHPPRGFDRLRR
jgi:hypothetical protein